MAVPRFDASELKIAGEKETFMGGKIPIYTYPVTPKEAVKSLYLKREAYWQVMNMEAKMFAPRIIADNISRAMVFDGGDNTILPKGGPDMFGVEWEFVEQAGGSMVRPGKPMLEDANDWRRDIKFPDLESWDWEAAAKESENFFSDFEYNLLWFQTGWFERLISFMDFEGALMALVDEDQTDAVKELLGALSDFYIKLLDKVFKYFPKLDGVTMHDDWGAQKESFFSPDLCAEMIVPHMRRVTDFVHSTGRGCELHSCGQIGKQVPNMIAAGWDAWAGQPMNDSHALYEKYGDKIVLGVSLNTPGEPVPENLSDDEIRALAKDYAQKFCNPKKPSMFSGYGITQMSPVFREALYVHSREIYGGNG